MSSIYGNRIKVSLFGESHGAAVGCVLDGLPAGLALDMPFIRTRLSQRQHGAFSIRSYAEMSKGLEEEDALLEISSAVTARSESLDFHVLSGLSDEGICQGSPFMAYFQNRDIRRGDYRQQERHYRPGHADYVSAMRSNGHADLSGGGHFSGRLTAPLVLAGAICEQILSRRGIGFSAHVENVGGCKSFAEINDFLESLERDGDSAGSEIKIRIDGMPLGVGSPFFDTLEGEISKLVFSVPAVKGIAFGAGFDFVEKRGSEVVDAFILAESDQGSGTHVVTDHNYNGGINGGISNGMPVEFRVAVKPTSSIRVPVRTLNFETMSQELLVTGGRHDKCIGFRAMVAIVAATAIALVNFTEGSESFDESVK
ncbi:MAG: chorismate synthase [Bacillota bacterium]|nr:chorismate synthase [Bacillota bacterium]